VARGHLSEMGVMRQRDRTLPNFLLARHPPVAGRQGSFGGDSRKPSRYKLRGFDVQAKTFPYSASKRLHAFSACGSL
jgi:hypothetical protein